MKKIWYGLFLLAAAGLIVFLLHNRSVHTGSLQNLVKAQTIIPDDTKKKGRTNATVQSVSDEEVESFIALARDEVFIHAIQVDLNGDDKEDRIIAAKKLSDMFIYLIVFLQDYNTQLFVRVGEIKTAVTQKHTVTLSVLPLRMSVPPAIACSGINNRNMHVFSLYMLNLSHITEVKMVPIVTLTADGQITVKKDETKPDNTLGQYEIHTYHSDPEAVHTLNQIKKIYTWNMATHEFEQSKAIHIPGKHIEANFLKKIRHGNKSTFITLLDGVWYRPSEKGTQHRSIFFNIQNKEIVFNVDNIEEVFNVGAASNRRYGIYVSTKNLSITSINRRLDIEFIGVDEVRVRVIDDVARLKIGTVSNWDGIYRKIKRTIRSSSSTMRHLKQQLQGADNNKKWHADNDYTLTFSDNEYTLIDAGASSPAEKKGRYTILYINTVPVLQTQSMQHKNRFFKISVDSGSTHKQQLVLTEVGVSINTVVDLGLPPLVFE